MKQTKKILLWLIFLFSTHFSLAFDFKIPEEVEPHAMFVAELSFLPSENQKATVTFDSSQIQFLGAVNPTPDVQSNEKSVEILNGGGTGKNVGLKFLHFGATESTTISLITGSKNFTREVKFTQVKTKKNYQLHFLLGAVIFFIIGFIFWRTQKKNVNLMSTRSLYMDFREFVEFQSKQPDKATSSSAIQDSEKLPSSQNPSNTSNSTESPNSPIPPNSSILSNSPNSQTHKPVPKVTPPSDSSNNSTIEVSQPYSTTQSPTPSQSLVPTKKIVTAQELPPALPPTPIIDLPKTLRTSPSPELPPTLPPSPLQGSLQTIRSTPLQELPPTLPPTPPTHSPMLLQSIQSTTSPEPLPTLQPVNQLISSPEQAPSNPPEASIPNNVTPTIDPSSLKTTPGTPISKASTKSKGLIIESKSTATPSIANIDSIDQKTSTKKTAPTKIQKIHLILEDDSKKTYECLCENEITIGRQKGSGIVMTASEISRNHASIACQNNEFFLKPLSQSNSTAINGKEIKNVSRINANDTIAFGGKKFIIRQIELF
ncbi:MAG: FHA domain-containing protein [Candidatus Riflebacteria bacterium]|nr:FHA domain-containing protein [Candidatus Riflebacteria bacterium]